MTTPALATYEVGSADESGLRILLLFLVLVPWGIRSNEMHFGLLILWAHLLPLWAHLLPRKGSDSALRSTVRIEDLSWQISKSGTAKSPGLEPINSAFVSEKSCQLELCSQ